jgi:hypothetical protein
MQNNYACPCMCYVAHCVCSFIVRFTVHCTKTCKLYNTPILQLHACNKWSSKVGYKISLHSIPALPKSDPCCALWQNFRIASQSCFVLMGDSNRSYIGRISSSFVPSGLWKIIPDFVSSTNESRGGSNYCRMLEQDRGELLSIHECLKQG